MSVSRMKMKTRWERGPRSTIKAPTNKGVDALMRGKHGGPIIQQEVVKVIEPREPREDA